MGVPSAGYRGGTRAIDSRCESSEDSAHFQEKTGIGLWDEKDLSYSLVPMQVGWQEGVGFFRIPFPASMLAKIVIVVSNNIHYVLH